MSDEFLWSSEEIDFRFVIDRDEFLSMVEGAYIVVPSSDANPSLLNFSIYSTGGILTISASDSRTSLISRTKKFNGSIDGSFLIPAKELVAILKVCPSGEVTVETAGKAACIRAGSAMWTVRLPAISSFPAQPDIFSVALSPVPKVEFIGALAAVKFAAASDYLQPSLIIVDVTEGVFTACDGLRFQQARTDISVDMQLPISAVVDLIRLVKERGKDTIYIGSTDTHLIFVLGRDVFIVQRNHTQFPAVEATWLRPALMNTNELRVNKQELLDAIARVRLAADTDTFAVIAEVSLGALVLRSQNAIGHTAIESLEVEWSGPKQSLIVNYQYLLDTVKAYPSEQCNFYLGSDKGSQKSFILLKDESSKYFGVLSQMSLARLR